jgi:hypothetical protein
LGYDSRREELFRIQHTVLKNVHGSDSVYIGSGSNEQDNMTVPFLAWIWNSKELLTEWPTKIKSKLQTLIQESCLLQAGSRQSHSLLVDIQPRILLFIRHSEVLRIV